MRHAFAQGLYGLRCLFARRAIGRDALRQLGIAHGLDAVGRGALPAPVDFTQPRHGLRVATHRAQHIPAIRLADVAHARAVLLVGIAHHRHELRVARAQSLLLELLKLVARHGLRRPATRHGPAAARGRLASLFKPGACHIGRLRCLRGLSRLPGLGSPGCLRALHSLRHGQGHNRHGRQPQDSDAAHGVSNKPTQHSHADSSLSSPRQKPPLPPHGPVRLPVLAQQPLAAHPTAWAR